jgi:hypothetical protein
MALVGGGGGGEGPPEDKWERALEDLEGLPPSWGLTEGALGECSLNIPSMPPDCSLKVP